MTVGLFLECPPEPDPAPDPSTGREDPAAPTGVADPPPAVVVRSLMALIALTGLVSLAMSVGGNEPYPGLLMPAFGHILEEPDGTVTTYGTRYRVVMPDGSTRHVDATELIPPAGPADYMMAQVIFSEPGVARRPQTKSWLADRLARSPRTRGAVRLQVFRVAKVYDADSHRELRRSSTPLLSVSLRVGR